MLWIGVHLLFLIVNSFNHLYISFILIKLFLENLIFIASEQRVLKALPKINRRRGQLVGSVRTEMCCATTRKCYLQNLVSSELLRCLLRTKPQQSFWRFAAVKICPLNWAMCWHHSPERLGSGVKDTPAFKRQYAWAVACMCLCFAGLYRGICCSLGCVRSNAREQIYRSEWNQIIGTVQLTPNMRQRTEWES